MNSATGSASNPADSLPAEMLADLLALAPEGVSPESLPAEMGERFEVRGVLGEGGQGVVLAVRDRRLDRDVAVKMARADRAGAEAHLEREARLAASLEHPNILPTYDLSEAPDGAPIMLMRRAPGRSLEEVLQSCDQPRGVATGALYSLSGRAARLRVFLQLAEAISYAHSRSVLHLDLKPANVRIGEYGEVFVMDWGLARRITDSAAPVGGTPPYMAPELLEGLVPDERADIYSLGVTLYRMLSGGSFPYEGQIRSTEDYRAVLAASLPVPLSDRVEDLDIDLAAVVDKACCPDRSRRYRKVRELVSDIEAALDGRPVSARRSSWPERLAKAAYRHRRVLAAVAAGVFILSVLGLLFHREQLRRREAARRLAAHRLRAKARVPFDKGMELAMRMPPDHLAADKHFSEALAIDPGFAEARYARGRSRQALGRYDAALKDLLAAAEGDPSLLMARYHAGRIMMEQRGDRAGAREQFQAMRVLDPRNEYSMLGEAWLATLDGDWDGALRLAEEAGRQDPSLAEVHNLRGYVFSNSRSPRRSPELAVASFSRYLKAVPHNVTALNNRAYALIQLGRPEEAEQDLDRALELDPDYVHALTNRGWLRGQRKDLEGAIADLDRAQQLNRGYVWVYLNRGEIYEQMGYYARAREDYIAAAGIESGSPVPCRRRARLELRAGNFGESAAQYARALELCRPEDLPVLRRKLGLALYYCGDLEGAVAAWRRNIAERAPGSKLYTGLLLWRLLCEQNRAPAARKMLSRLAADDLEKPHLRRVAGYCLGTAGPGEVLELTDSDREECEAFYYMAAANLVRGSFEISRILFNACRMTGASGETEFILAQVELRAMSPEEDPLPTVPEPEPEDDAER